MTWLCFTELLGGRVLQIDDLEESTLEQRGSSALSWPSGPSQRDGSVFVAATGSHEVALCDGGGGGWTRLGSYGSQEGQFASPAATGFRLDGGLVVLDSGNGRVVGMDDISGSGWTAYGHRGQPTSSDPAEGAFADPRGLAVDTSGRIWVADPGAARLTRIDGLDGSGWTQIPLPAGANAPRPYGLGAHQDGVVLLDAGNARVLILDGSGTVTASLDLDDDTWSSPLFVTSLGDDLAVADVAANELRLLHRDGDRFTVTATLRGSPPHLLDPLFDSVGGLGT